MRLEGRVALVTGGGSGIGRAVCRRFHEEGATVFVNDRSRARAEAVVAELGLSRKRALVADVSRSRQVATMFGRLEALDVLVTAAGIAEPEQRWKMLNRRAETRLDEVDRKGRAETPWKVTARMEDHVWREMMAVHLDGTFYCTREALKLMEPKRSGAVIHVSSTAALAGLPDAPHYAAAKAGILGFTRSVALEVAALGIRVNAIAPGLTETPMTAGLSPRVRRARTGSIPLGRWASPQEIASVVLFLASNESSYVTGQCLSPNGGSFPG